MFALTLGVALGLVLRRPLPAMALTLAVFTFVQIAIPLWVRPHLASTDQQIVTISTERLDGIEASGPGAPMHITVTTGSPGDWILTNETVDSSGHAVALPAWMAGCVPGPPSSPDEGAVRVQAPATDIETCFTRLADEGYRQRVVYHPASHFWPLQWAETGLFLAFSGLLAGFCFWWIRRVS